jgi:glycosyltransferase involved in cell wall biosynthesis
LVTVPDTASAERRASPGRFLGRPLRKLLRRHFGWLPLYELRNKVRYGHTVPRVWLFESAEVRRLRATLPKGAAPLVTVVIPTYRRPETLPAAVRSVLAQTIGDLRVIVVDDGGGGLPELPDDPRLVVVSLARNTAVLGVVRNVGIRLADSEFVAFLDDDNEWEPEHLATALAALRPGPDADISMDTGIDADTGTDTDTPGRRGRRAPAGVYTALRRVLPDGREVDVLSVPFDRRLAREEGFLDANGFVAHRSRALRFSRLRRDRGVLPREDWATLYRYSRRHPIQHVPVPTVRYLVNPNTYYTVWDPIES